MPGSRRPVGYLLYAAWFGMIAAAGEIAVLGYRKYVRHESLLLGPDVLWMTPLATTLLVALPALAFAGVSRWRGRPPGTTRSALFAFAFIGGAGVLLGIPRLHPAALLLLAAALAWRLSRAIPVQSEWMTTLVRRTAVGLCAGFVLLGVFVGGGRRLAERRLMASLTEPAAGAPNVLLIIWDTVRAASLGLYGYERATSPNLQRLADQGVVFTRAFATAPWTLPSHASMFTGRFASEMTADFRTPLDDSAPTLAEALVDRGYLTAGFVGNTYYTGRESGLARGFIHYDDYPVSGPEFVLSSALGRALVTSNAWRHRLGRTDIFARRSAADVTGRFLGWLDRRPDRPFFAFINLFDAHEPYRPPARFESLYGPQTARSLTRIDHHQLRNGTRWGRRNMAPEERQAEQDAYDGAITYLDHELAALLAELERRGLRENTIVIVTSDHGEHFGEHGMYTHGNSVYTPVTHVPLVISGSERVPAGLRQEQAVSLRALAATVLDLVQPGAPHGFPGLSLASAWRASESGSSDTVLAEYEDEDLRSVVDGPLHYVFPARGAAELYDLDTDLMETTNLAAGDSAAAMIERVRVRYRAHLLREWKRGREPARRQIATNGTDVP